MAFVSTNRFPLPTVTQADGTLGRVAATRAAAAARGAKLGAYVQASPLTSGPQFLWPAQRLALMAQQAAQKAATKAKGKTLGDISCSIDPVTGGRVCSSSLVPTSPAPGPQLCPPAKPCPPCSCPPQFCDCNPQGPIGPIAPPGPPWITRPVMNGGGPRQIGGAGMTAPAYRYMLRQAAVASTLSGIAARARQTRRLGVSPTPGYISRTLGFTTSEATKALQQKAVGAGQQQTSAVPMWAWGTIAGAVTLGVLAAISKRSKVGRPIPGAHVYEGL